MSFPKLYVGSFGVICQVNLLTVDWSATTSKEAEKMSEKTGRERVSGLGVYRLGFRVWRSGTYFVFYV